MIKRACTRCFTPTQNPLAEYCSVCGTRLPIITNFCPSCGAKLVRGQNYCSLCGTRFEGVADLFVPQDIRVSQQHYLDSPEYAFNAPHNRARSRLRAIINQRLKQKKAGS